MKTYSNLQLEEIYDRNQCMGLRMWLAIERDRIATGYQIFSSKMFMKEHEYCIMIHRLKFNHPKASEIAEDFIKDQKRAEDILCYTMFDSPEYPIRSLYEKPIETKENLTPIQWAEKYNLKKSLDNHERMTYVPTPHLKDIYKALGGRNYHRKAVIFKGASCGPSTQMEHILFPPNSSEVDKMRINSFEAYKRLKTSLDEADAFAKEYSRLEDINSKIDFASAAIAISMPLLNNNIGIFKTLADKFKESAIIIQETSKKMGNLYQIIDDLDTKPDSILNIKEWAVSKAPKEKKHGWKPPYKYHK